MGIDTNGVQLFDAATKVLIDGESALPPYRACTNLLTVEHFVAATVVC
jgi:hypothetical protein